MQTSLDSEELLECDMDTDTHLAALKGQYLHGILDAGFSRGELTAFLDSHKSGGISQWSLEQLKSAVTEFTQMHYTAREVELDKKLQNYELEKQRRKEWRRGFIDGTFGENEGREFEAWVGRKGVKDALSEDDLKSLAKAFKSKDDRALSACLMALSHIEINEKPSPKPSPLSAPSPPPKDSDVLSPSHFLSPAVPLPLTLLTPLSDLEVSVEQYSPLRYTRKKWYVFEDTGYLVSTKQLDWFADRSMKDFAKLAESIEKAFPGYVLPMLPGPEATDKQLQWYLRRLLSLEILRKSPHLASFLMDEVFSPPEPVTTSQKRLQRVEDMWSLSGSLTCDADEGSEHISWQTDFFMQDEAAKQKLVDHLLAGEVHQLHAVECIRVSQKMAEYLNNLTSSFLSQSTIAEEYKSLSDLLDDWCHFSELFHSLLKRYIVALLTAGVQDYSSVGRLIDMRNTYLAEYRRDKSCSVTRDIYGFLNHQSKTEIPRLVEFHLATFSKAMKIMCSELSREAQSLSERWTSK